MEEKRAIQERDTEGDPAKGDTSGSDLDHDAILTEFSKEEEKRIMRRVDLRLVFSVGLILMDRTNLSAASIAGMGSELQLSINNRYSIITLVFFTVYIVFQFPATVVIKKLGPRNFLSTITFTWGIILIGMGFANNWHTMAALRVVLGILEAGFFPGSIYLLSTWYTRFEVQKRYSVFYIFGSLASGCAGILAYGFMQMGGLQGLSPWRWIFIMEGVLTCIVAFIGYIFLVNFPDDAHKSWNFLTERETRFVLACVQADRQDAITESWAWSKFLRPALDLKTWCFAMLFGMNATVSYALSFFLPIILHDGMGFSVGAAQCLVAPPYAAAAIMMFVTAWVGDKYRMRGPPLIFNSIICIIGLPIIGWSKILAVRYFGVFLVCMGTNSNVPTILSYQANNIRGHWKRAFCSATLVGFGGIGGIIGSLVFRSKDSPNYIPGLWACITCQLIIIVIVLGLSVYFHFKNKKADRGEIIIEEIEGFRYTI